MQQNFQKKHNFKSFIFISSETQIILLDEGVLEATAKKIFAKANLEGGLIRLFD